MKSEWWSGFRHATGHRLARDTELEFLGFLEPVVLIAGCTMAANAGLGPAGKKTIAADPRCQGNSLHYCASVATSRLVLSYTVELHSIACI